MAKAARRDFNRRQVSPCNRRRKLSRTKARDLRRDAAFSVQQQFAINNPFPLGCRWYAQLAVLSVRNLIVLQASVGEPNEDGR